jgi:NAD(P)-dependent dehydrogenase (short-subunit alcohol dehydrogenase family)
MTLQGKIALITGGNKGIGMEIARAYAQAGARVVITGRDADALKHAATEIDSSGGTVLPFSGDVTDPAQVAHIVEETQQAFGPITICVNNAGIALSHKLVDHPDEMWHHMMAVNVTGPYYVCKAVVPGMIEAGGGRIINLGSVASKAGNAYMVAYTASKHAVLGLTRALAVELNRYQITVNAICPGYVDTPMVDLAIENLVKTTGRTREEAHAYFASTTPQNRLFDVKEVSHVALMLAEDAAAGITGQAINVDGGMVMY